MSGQHKKLDDSSLSALLTIAVNATGKIVLRFNKSLWIGQPK
jgi:hypothetical protein